MSSSLLLLAGMAATGNLHTVEDYVLVVAFGVVYWLAQRFLWRRRPRRDQRTDKS
ncbi:hypothetical protein HF998_06635 [Cellulomonas hominis]|uniref:Uncharacterized protein n=1 Tax=Cellulomonas hominis TaxID=156981 RepID=A0A7W8W975_9CELL|nr:hypothetical protein [Cellulomonas hominis]MBB5472596.1 hypothetical protein [Cellulomonas hominis]NKY06648.1 hypothetical protein [Cellulomonas hominis]